MLQDDCEVLVLLGVTMMVTFARLTLKSHHVLLSFIFFIVDIPRVSASF